MTMLSTDERMDLARAYAAGARIHAEAIAPRVTHNGLVSETRGRTPYAACCACGWVSWGYVSVHAAQIMADDHTMSMSS